MQHTIESDHRVKLHPHIRLQADTRVASGLGHSIAPSAIGMSSISFGALGPIAPFILTRHGARPPVLSERVKQNLDAMDVEQRVKCVQQLLQLLHLTEFVLLVELIEVVVPLGYSTFFVCCDPLPLFLTPLCYRSLQSSM
jgi:hypothetical protein